MNKTELINVIASKTGDTKKATEAFVNAFVETVEETLVTGEAVKLVGHGTYDVKDTDARKGRNPKTGEEIDVEASRRPTFKYSKNVKEAVSTK